MSRQPIQQTEFAAIDVTLLAADAEERLAQLIFRRRDGRADKSNASSLRLKSCAPPWSRSASFSTSSRPVREQEDEGGHDEPDPDRDRRLLGCGTGSRWESSSQRPKEHASQSYTQFLELSWPG